MVVVLVFRKHGSIGPTYSEQASPHKEPPHLFFEPGELGFSVTKAAKGCNLGWLQRVFHMKMPG